MSLSHLTIANIFGVEGKHVLITGGGSGLGEATAKAYAVNGAHVYIVGRRAEKLDETKADAEKSGDLKGSITSLPGDVGSKENILGLVKAYKATGAERLDVLINNCGIDISPEDPCDPDDTEKLEGELWDKVEWSDFSKTFDVNTTAIYFTTVGFLPLLRKSESPRVIVTSSIGAYSMERHIGGPTYNASKAAALQLTKVLASKLIPYKIACNTILPGLFPSEMTTPSKEDMDKGPMAGAYRSIPLGRPGREEEIAGVMIMLGSAAGGYCNASVIVVDGGRLIMTSAQD